MARSKPYAFAFCLLGVVLLAVLVQQLLATPVTWRYPDVGTPELNKTCNLVGYCTDDNFSQCYNYSGPQCPDDERTPVGKILLAKRRLGVCQFNPPPATNPGCEYYWQQAIDCMYYRLYHVVENVGGNLTCSEPMCFMHLDSEVGDWCIYADD